MPISLVMLIPRYSSLQVEISHKKAQKTQRKSSCVFCASLWLIFLFYN